MGEEHAVDTLFYRSWLEGGAEEHLKTPETLILRKSMQPNLTKTGGDG